MSAPDRQRPIRIVFCGTPAFAVPALQALHGDGRFKVVLTVTQPDRVAGRGRKLVMPAVKVAALELGLPVHQPEQLRTIATRQPLVDAGADVFVVAAYGVIFGPKTLAIPRSSCLNLHASILPAYRGASPISAAIAAGESSTGVTLMRMEAGLDTGPMIGRNMIDITATDTTESLTARLAVAGADIVTKLIPAWVAGEIEAVAQPPGATLTRPMVKADGWLDWSRPAAELEAQIRAMWPWPRAWTTEMTTDGQPKILQVHAAAVVEDQMLDQQLIGAIPGTILHAPGKLVVSTGSGAVALGTVQEPGGRPVPGQTLLLAGGVSVGTVLGQSGAPEVVSPLVRAAED